MIFFPPDNLTFLRKAMFSQNLTFCTLKKKSNNYFLDVSFPLYNKTVKKKNKERETLKIPLPNNS